MKITLDTNFLISATQWDNSVAYKLLMDLLNTNTELFTTKEILDEFSKVLKRDFKYTKEETDEIIQRVLGFLKLVEIKEKVNVVKDDPDDNKIIECAIESKSKYIITYDNHLLNIVGYREIKMIKPEEARKILFS